MNMYHLLPELKKSFGMGGEFIEKNGESIQWCNSGVSSVSLFNPCAALKETWNFIGVSI